MSVYANYKYLNRLLSEEDSISVIQLKAQQQKKKLKAFYIK